jgi:C1A family cysteine protease
MRVLFLAVFFALLAAFANSPAAIADSAAEPKLELLPPNPKDVEYWEKVRAGERPSGAAPSPVDWAALKNGKSAANELRIASVLPTAYDLVDEGVTPPVSNQQEWGTCWSFATIESIESSLLLADKINGTSNYKPLSELHLAYYAFEDEGGDKVSFTGSEYDEDGKPQNRIFDNGGTTDVVIALLSRGTGPVAYEDAPYPNNLDEDDWIKYLPNPAPSGKAQFRLKNAYYFRNEPDAIKEALMKYGALAFAFGYYDDTTSGDTTFYTPASHEQTSANHAVLLVGWDDDYPKDAFGPDTPENDGAWKIQNSWGTSAGTKGFYWISYEDATIFGGGGEAQIALPAAFEMMPASVYDDDGIYFHDALGMNGAVTVAELDSLTVANAFTARRDEKIVYVGFMTGQDEQDCEIQVYRNITGGGAPGAGEAVFAEPVSTHVSDGGGYVSVKLDNPVQLRRGERFAVAVTFKRPDGADRVGVPIEAHSVGAYDEDDIYQPSGYEKVSMNPGESYYLAGNEWRDIYYDPEPYDEPEPGEPESKGNFCVKAFTVSSPAGGSGSGGGCDSVSFGLFGIAGVALLMFVRKNKSL